MVVVMVLPVLVVFVSSVLVVMVLPVVVGMPVLFVGVVMLFVCHIIIIFNSSFYILSFVSRRHFHPVSFRPPSFLSAKVHHFLCNSVAKLQSRRAKLNGNDNGNDNGNGNDNENETHLRCYENTRSRRVDE